MTANPAAAALPDALRLHDAGRLAEAEPLFEAVLAAEPDHAEALYRLGVIALQSQRHARGADLLRRAIAARPDQPAAHANLGYALRALGELLAALDAYDRAIALRPDYVQALNNRASVLNDLGRFTEALDSSDRAAALAPDDDSLQLNRGNALLGVGRAGEALESFERVLRRTPGHVGALYNRGNALAALGRPDDAALSYEAALSRDPRHARAHANLGNQLLELGRPEAALARLEAAVAIDPSLVEAFNGQGEALVRLGRHREAVERLDRALTIRPDYPNAQWNRALARLSLGDFPTGWADYEARWRLGRAPLAPALHGRLSHPAAASELAGRSVLLLAEQGIGDVIMFASLLPDLLAVAGPVALACETRLHRLFASSFPGLELIAPDAAEAAAPGCERVVPIGGLARPFRRRAEDFPRRPYLHPGAAAQDAWAAKLGPKSARLRVGLSWRGGTAKTGRDARSIPVDALAPLLYRPDCEFVSLQYGDHAAEVAQANSRLGRPIHLPAAGDIADFEDLAAAVLAMDVVVSVQTTLVHLSGALGAPALAMLPQVAEWRYTASGATMPWYGSVSLFRQDAARDWTPVVAAVAARLDTLA